jgi:hypothetical protein
VITDFGARKAPIAAVPDPNGNFTTNPEKPNPAAKGTEAKY